MFDEFNPSRKKRSVATRYEDDGLTRVKCSVSFGGGGGGGGSTQSTATSYNTNIPEYAQPYVQTMLNATQQQLFNINDKGQVTGFAPYRAYGGTYDQAGNMTAYNPAAGIAGFTPLQQQVQENIANLQVPTQFGAASDLSAAAGEGGLESAQRAYGYGTQGAAYGAQGAQLGIQGGQRYGESGYQSGMLGQQLGVSGGAYYGGMGAGYGAQGAEYGAQAAALAPQAQAYGAQGAGYGAQAAALAPQAQAYGQTAADIGRMGLEAQTYGRDVGEQARQYAAQAAAAGQQYAQQATSPSAVQAYMSPYQQAVTDVQKQAAEREFAVQSQARKAAAARTGAYGGARQAIEQAEATRNLNTQLQAIQATGSQAAYDRALQSLQYGTSTGLQGLQGAQAGLGTALQGGQLGLSGIGQAMAGQQAGVSALGQAGNLYGVGMQGAQTGLQGLGQAGQLYGVGIQGAQAGMQGAQTGLQGVQAQLAGTAQGMQGAQVGLSGVDRQLAGTAQGMQGTQVGLQGVQGAQAGYGLANQAAGTLGSLGTQQLAAQQGILGLQSQAGAQQQAYQQQILNQAMQDYANAQQYPLMQLGTLSNMLRGLPMQSTTTQQYIAQPNQTTQALGTLGTAASLYGAMKAKGGIIDAKKYAAGGTVEGSVEAKLYDMQPEQLQKELQSPSGEIRKMAKRIMAEKAIEGKAGGGIIAFAGGTPDPEILPEEPRERTATDVQYAAPNEQAPQGIAAVPAPAPRQAAPVIPAKIDTSAAGIKRAGADLYAQQAARATRPIEEAMAEKERIVGPDTAGQDYRKKIMEERANAGDEAVRQNWMRAAQFFADWGSRPGNTLAAGMLALKNTLPDVITDQRDQKKYLREIDKTLYELDRAARAEKAGNYDKMTEIQQKAGDNAFKVFGNLSDIARTEISAGATVAAANAGAGKATDFQFRYATRLNALTNGKPETATPEQKDAAASFAANQLRGTETKLGIQQTDAETKALKEDDELKGLISKKKMLSITPKMAEKNKDAIDKLDDDIAAQEARVLARARRQPQPAAAEPTTTGAPAAKTVSFGDLPK